MTLGKKLMYGVLTLFVVSLLIAGGSSTTAASSAPAASKGGAAAPALKDVNIVGNPKAPVKLIAFYPFSGDHIPIAQYLLTLPKKFDNKVYVEVYDMQSEKGRDKWSSSGLQCAGVFVNGKTSWEVLRAGKKETINFVKRMGSFWSSADLEAVIKSQLKNPKAIPEVPKETKPAKPADKGK